MHFSCWDHLCKKLYCFTQVNSEGGLSPGMHTVDYAEKCARHRKHSQDVTTMPSTKRRRLILKQERSVNQIAKESLEGVSYQSGNFIFDFCVVHLTLFQTSYSGAPECISIVIQNFHGIMISVVVIIMVRKNHNFLIQILGFLPFVKLS